MRRAPLTALALTALFAVALPTGGCRWLAGQTSADVEGEGSSDPAALRPKCRPASAVTKRGDAPWTKGDTIAGWSVTDANKDNLEFVRYTLTKGDETTGIEVAFHEGPPDDWATASYRLMPNPTVDAKPPRELLDAAMARLREWQDVGGTPFAMRRSGVEDPYEGLPLCEG